MEDILNIDGRQTAAVMHGPGLTAPAIPARRLRQAEATVAEPSAGRAFEGAVVLSLLAVQLPWVATLGYLLLRFAG